MKKLAFLVPMLYLWQAPALAQDCSPQRIVVGFAAGGGADAMARLVAQRLAAKNNRTVVVENRTGAGGNIAAEFVAKSRKDGCTVLLTGSSHNLNPYIYSRAGYETKDFAPLHPGITGVAVVTAAANQPFKTLGDLVAQARSNPGKIAYGTSGIGSVNHLAMEMLTKAAGVNMVHVPYKGAAPAMADTVAGIVPLSVGSAASSEAFVAAGKVVPLAVSGPRRWPTLPNVPTVAEAGFPAATYLFWTGFLAPAGTPAAVLDKLNREIDAVMQEPDSRERLLKMGYEAAHGTVQEFGKFLVEDEATYRRLAQDMKLKVE